MIGDRLDTDIEGGRVAGMPTLLVLTGVSDAAELFPAPAERRPDYVSATSAASPTARTTWPSADSPDGTSRAAMGTGR